MNPYQSRRLARRLHVDRERRIEKLLVRLAAEGALDDFPEGTPSEPFAWDQTHKVLSQSYVWCDVHGEIHGARPNFYQTEGDEDCKEANWRSVYVASTDPGDEF